MSWRPDTFAQALRLIAADYARQDDERRARAVVMNVPFEGRTEVQDDLRAMALWLDNEVWVGWYVEQMWKRLP